MTAADTASLISEPTPAYTAQPIPTYEHYPESAEEVLLPAHTAPSTPFYTPLSSAHSLPLPTIPYRSLLAGEPGCYVPPRPNAPHPTHSPLFTPTRPLDAPRQNRNPRRCWAILTLIMVVSFALGLSIWGITVTHQKAAVRWAEAVVKRADAAAVEAERIKVRETRRRAEEERVLAEKMREEERKRRLEEAMVEIAELWIERGGRVGGILGERVIGF